MADKSVKVTLRADVANYVRGMQEAGRATDEVTRGSKNIEDWGARYGEAMTLVGGQAMIAGGLIVAGLGLATKAAIDWESGWTGVLKTVDGTPAQLAAVEEGLRDLTAVLPASHTEIAAVAEAAGQLGIQTPNVVAFTETMINLGETTNLSAEEAATSLAQFMNIMGTAQSDVSNLGSAIVGLGNNFATTEADILEMATRLAGAGSQVGMTEGEVLGLATALSSVGIEAEAGGSSVSKVMIDIAAAVDEGGARLDEFATVAGTSADDFAEKWRTNPGAALQLFIDGLANAESQGKTTLGVLADLGITEVRMRDALLRAAQASDLFTGAMEMGNEEFERNLALQEEAELRYGTTESKIGILRNRFTEMGIELGTALLPAVEMVADGIGFLADTLGKLFEGPGGDIVAWGSLVAGSLLLAGGAFLILVPQIAATSTALQTLGVNWASVQAVMSGAKFNLMSFLASPGVLLGVAAGVAAIATALVLYKQQAEAAERQSVELNAAVTGTADGVEVLALAAEHMADNSLIPAVNESDYQRTRAQLEDLSGVLQKLIEQDEGFNLGLEMDLDTNYSSTTAAIREMGDELAALAETDISGVKSMLTDVREQYGLTAEEMWQFIDESPELVTALQNQALMAGEAVGDLGSLEEQLALVDWATAADDADALNAELEAQEAAAEAAAAEIDGLADAIRALDDLMSGMVNSELAYYDALQSVTEALATNGATVDINTEAGRKNIAALDDLAVKSTEYAASVLEMNGSQAEAAAILENSKDAWIEQAELLGYTAEEAQYLADKYFQIPGEVLTNVHDGGTIDATVMSVEELDGTLAALPPNTFVEVTGLTSEAMARLEELGYTVRTLPDGTVVVVTEGTGQVEGELDALTQPRTVVIRTLYEGVSASASATGVQNAVGNLYQYANGGAVIHRGLPTAIYPGGANIHKFAEPETRWEAYISGKPGQEQRNIQIALESLRRLGYDRHEAYADGGLRDYMNQAVQVQASAPVVNVSSPRSGPSFQNQFNVTEQVSSVELAGLVRREIRLELKKGGL